MASWSSTAARASETVASSFVLVMASSIASGVATQTRTGIPRAVLSDRLATLVEQKATGTYQAVGPAARLEFGGMLDRAAHRLTFT